MITSYASLMATGHPIANARGRVRLHRKVLYNKIGTGSHACHWCGRDISWKTGRLVGADYLVADHLDGNPGNNDPGNIVASCNQCNSGRSKGRGRIRAGEPYIVSGGIVIRADSFNCRICGSPYLSRTNVSGVPYKKTCSRPCTSRAQSNALRGVKKPRTISGYFVMDKNGHKVSCEQRLCLVCGKSFLAIRSHIKLGRGKVCSATCRAEHNHIRAVRKLISKECEVCGVTFQVNHGRVKCSPCRTCSKSCAGTLRVREGKFAMLRIRVA